MTRRERLRMHLTTALTRADGDARAHVRAALDVLDETPPTPIVECPLCGRAGLPERVAETACPHD